MTTLTHLQFPVEAVKGHRAFFIDPKHPEEIRDYAVVMGNRAAHGHVRVNHQHGGKTFVFNPETGVAMRYGEIRQLVILVPPAVFPGNDYRDVICAANAAWTKLLGRGEEAAKERLAAQEQNAREWNARNAAPVINILTTTELRTALKSSLAGMKVEMRFGNTLEVIDSDGLVVTRFTFNHNLIPPKTRPERGGIGINLNEPEDRTYRGGIGISLGEDS